MMQYLDRTAPVRKGEELDVGELETYLAERIPGFMPPVSIEQFPGGHSNLTYCIRGGDLELVLRRPPHGSKVKSAHDMGREYRVLSKLNRFFGPAPRPLLYCDDASVVGVPFYVMERIRGAVFRAEKPPDFDLSQHKIRDCCYSFIETLGDLHRLDYREVGLEDLYKGPGYVARQVSGWERRWQDAKTDEVPDMDRVLPWLKQHLPEDSDATIIHNDYKFDNLVFGADDVTKVAGVLDWEMSTIGDPLSDLAVTLSSWGQRRDDPQTTVATGFMSRESGALTREELVEAYRRHTGRDVSNLHYYFVLACFKGAVIIEQIYHRYDKGLTDDPRFAPLHDVTRALASRAARVMDAGRIAPGM